MSETLTAKPIVHDDGPLATLFDTARFEHCQRIAHAFSNSTLVPTHFQGQTANCFIALQLAVRLQVDPFMLMQSLYVVHGKPGLEAKLAIALLYASGRIKGPIRYREDGDGDGFGCTAWVVDSSAGEVIDGIKVDWKMVKAEGWDQPKGNQPSKWKTMPAIMFRYRAAMLLIRTQYPDVILGLQSREELEDAMLDAEFVAGQPAAMTRVEYTSRSDALAEAMATMSTPQPVAAEPPKPEPKEPPKAKPEPKPEPKPAAKTREYSPFEQYALRIHDAKTVDAVQDVLACAEADGVLDKPAMERLFRIGERRGQELAS